MAMTALIGFQWDGIGYLVADSFIGNSVRRNILGESKVLQVVGKEKNLLGLLGISGDMRATNILNEYNRILVKETDKNMTPTHIVFSLVEHIKRRFDYYKYSKEKSGQATHDSQMIFITSQYCYSIWDEYDYVKHKSPYVAGGSALDFAYGALAMLFQTDSKTWFAVDDYPAESFARALMESVAMHHPYIAPPFCLWDTKDGYRGHEL